MLLIFFGGAAMDIKIWTKTLTEKLLAAFGDRVVFIGLQGSRGRGEARPSSDIDMVVVLNEMTFEDLSAYGALLESMPEKELACGFISGKKELLGWLPSELFTLYHDTVPIYGTLDFIKGYFTKNDAAAAVATSACAIYHGCCHNFLYEKSGELLSALYKSAFFTLRAELYCKTGRYVKRSDELEGLLYGAGRDVLSFLHKNFERKYLAARGF